MKLPTVILLLGYLITTSWADKDDPVRWENTEFTLKTQGKTQGSAVFEGKNISGKKQTIKIIKTNSPCTQTQTTSQEVEPNNWIILQAHLKFPQFPTEETESIDIEWESGETSHLVTHIQGPRSPRTIDSIIIWEGTIEEKEIKTTGENIIKADTTKGWTTRIQDGKLWIKPQKMGIKGLVTITWEIDIGYTTHVTQTVRLESWKN